MKFGKHGRLMSFTYEKENTIYDTITSQVQFQRNLYCTLFMAVQETYQSNIEEKMKRDDQV